MQFPYLGLGIQLFYFVPCIAVLNSIFKFANFNSENRFNLSIVGWTPLTRDQIVFHRPWLPYFSSFFPKSILVSFFRSSSVIPAAFKLAAQKVGCELPDRTQ